MPWLKDMPQRILAKIQKFWLSGIKNWLSVERRDFNEPSP
jgi:hypothetical protein